MNDDVVKKLEYWAFKLCGKGEQEDAASDVMSEASKEIIKLRAERRERIATAALQGMLSDPGASGTATEYAEYATQYADALIAALDKEPQP